MTLISKIIKDCLTGIDGETYDPARIYGALAVNVFFFNSMYALYKGQTWDPVNYGTGFGLLLAAFGAAVALKSKTEPTQADAGK